LGNFRDKEGSEDKGTREDNNIEDLECIAQGNIGGSLMCTGLAILEL
jgi:hypothetical protein